jgi:hypothetical protein
MSHNYQMWQAAGPGACMDWLSASQGAMFWVSMVAGMVAPYVCVRWYNLMCVYTVHIMCTHIMA